MNSVKLITKENEFNISLLFFEKSDILKKYFEDHDILDYDNELIEIFIRYYFLYEVDKINNNELLKNLFLFCDKFQFINIYKKIFENNEDYINKNISQYLDILNPNIIKINNDNLKIEYIKNDKIFKLFFNDNIDNILYYLKYKLEKDQKFKFLEIIDKYLENDDNFKSVFENDLYNFIYYFYFTDKRDIFLEKIIKYLKNNVTIAQIIGYKESCGFYIYINKYDNIIDICYDFNHNNYHKNCNYFNNESEYNKNENLKNIIIHEFNEKEIIKYFCKRNFCKWRDCDHIDDDFVDDIRCDRSDNYFKYFIDYVTKNFYQT